MDFADPAGDIFRELWAEGMISPTMEGDMAGPRSLLLFDIDGTLMRSGGIGRSALNAAFHELYGWSNALDDMTLDGMTDGLILDAVLESRGRLGDPHDPIFDCYNDHLKAHAGELREGGALPGVRDILEHLKGDERFELALLTGNGQRGAWIKLGRFGLDRYFSFGAFGDDAKIRTELLPIAVSRSSSLAPRPIVVIGDTPADIAVARAHGAFAWAVATGFRFGFADLEAEAPDLLMENLADVDGVLEVFGEIAEGTRTPRV